MRAAAAVPGPLRRRRRRGSSRRSRRFRPARCAPGARRSASRPSSAPRTCVSEGFQGLALAAGLAAAARWRSGVQFALRHRWTGWDDERATRFHTPEGKATVDARATVLALGGASWPRLGSTAPGSNAPAEGVAISRSGRPIRLHRCLVGRFSATASRASRSRAWRCRSGAQVRGEAMITRQGIEGGAVYALSADLREAVDNAGQPR